MVVVAPDGSALAAAAAELDPPRLAVAPTTPVARAGVGALAVHLLAVLEQLGQFADADRVGRRRGQRSSSAGDRSSRPTRRPPASPGASAAPCPIVYGSDDLAGVAARHWKRQVNLERQGGRRSPRHCRSWPRTRSPGGASTAT